MEMKIKSIQLGTQIKTIQYLRYIIYINSKLHWSTLSIVHLALPAQGANFCNPPDPSLKLNYVMVCSPCVS